MPSAMKPSGTSPFSERIAREIAKRRPQLPILVMSGLATSHPAMQEAEAAFKVLHKPFGEQEFKAALGALESGEPAC